MSAIAAAIASMRAKGMSDTDILDIVAAMAAAETAPVRTARQERNARYYASQKRLKASESDVSDGIKTVSDAPRAPLTRAEPEPNKTTSSPVQKNILTDIPKVPVAKPKSADAMCVAELGKVLDPEHARAVVEHRNRMRKPMTAHAAGLLAKRLSTAPDPNAAADEMIERGWQGWRPEWGQNSQAPPHRQAKSNSLLEGLEEIENLRFGNVQSFARIAN